MEEELEKPNVLEDPKVKNIKRIKRFSLIILAIFIASAVITGSYYFLNQKTIPIKIPGISQPPKPTPSAQIPGAIAKVGEEYIYQTDFATEKNLFPLPPGSDSKKVILDRLTTDSIILQGAQAEGLIKLDLTIFNSKDKDYKKRIETVDKIKKDIEKQADTLSGKVVSIWFLNLKVGPLGYEKAKQIAYEKISKLHQDVKNKKITIDQAGIAIAKDTSLAQLDEAYKSNAIFQFTVKKDQSPTFSDQMNQAMRNSPIGTITDVYTVQSEDWDQNFKYVDAYYSFGQVTDKQSKGKFVSFNDWYKNIKDKYNVQIY